jgi:3-oxoadipate enol-lactonase
MKKPHLHSVKEGSGPVVVLSHALGCELGMWDGVAAVLKQRYTVLRYDHRGHGRSEAVAGPYTIAMLADDAAGIIETHGGGPVHFVGLSMGGMTSQALAAKYPQLVKSITIANAAMYYDEAARAMWAARVQTVLARAWRRLPTARCSAGSHPNSAPMKQAAENSASQR